MLENHDKDMNSLEYRDPVAYSRGEKHDELR